jgi:hypothetical protein
MLRKLRMFEPMTICLPGWMAVNSPPFAFDASPEQKP